MCRQFILVYICCAFYFLVSCYINENNFISHKNYLLPTPKSNAGYRPALARCRRCIDRGVYICICNSIFLACRKNSISLLVSCFPPT